MSECLPNNHGVPQGSILGPLLFLIYVNDIFNQVKFSKLLLYADDTTLICSHKQLSCLISYLNVDLKIVSKYCSDNQLCLNPKKSKMIIFYPRTNIDYSSCILHIGDGTIDRVYSHKFLGIRLDDKLTCLSQCKHVVSKLSSTSYILYKFRYSMSRHMLLMIFNAIGISHIYYADIAYLFGCDSNSFKRVESRFIDCGRKGSSRTEVPKKLNWNPLSQMLLYHQYIFLYKCI